MTHVRRLAALGVALLAMYLTLQLAAWWIAAPGRDLYDGELATQAAFAEGVDHWVASEVDRGQFATGSPLLDGEWAFATRQMAVLGYGQLIETHPDDPDVVAHWFDQIDVCLDALVEERARAFDEEAWRGYDPLDDLGSSRPHMGYLGYLSLSLAYDRFLRPDSPHAALEGRVIAHLVRLMESGRAREIGLLETYPGQIFPIDNVTFFGALALHDRATGEDHSALLTRLLETLQTRYRDDATGLLIQRVDLRGRPVDEPRGSGTAFAAYFVSFADMELSRSLYGSIQGELVGSLFGFGAVREYPRGNGGSGDIDSGPVILGQAVSTTGFTLALARQHGDRDTFMSLYATAALFGAPRQGDHAAHYVMGGPIGDALMFALTTAVARDQNGRAR